MTIREFADELFHCIKRESPHAALVDERDFEQHHIIQSAWDLSLAHPEIQVFVHPWRERKRCRPSCKTAAADPAQRVRGCRRCWHDSKRWAMVEAFGTQNNFDLVARDRAGGKLAEPGS